MHESVYSTLPPQNWAGVTQSVQLLAKGLTVRVSIPGKGEIYRTLSITALGPTQPPLHCVLCLSLVKKV